MYICTVDDILSSFGENHVSSLINVSLLALVGTLLTYRRSETRKIVWWMDGRCGMVVVELGCFESWKVEDVL